jgi:hypothetical protein
MIYNPHLPLDAHVQTDPASGGDVAYQADCCQGPSALEAFGLSRRSSVRQAHATVDLEVLEDPPLC